MESNKNFYYILALFVALGIAIGTIYGAWSGNIGAWPASGAGIGTALGAGIGFAVKK